MAFSNVVGNTFEIMTPSLPSGCKFKAFSGKRLHLQIINLGSKARNKRTFAKVAILLLHTL
jgi:hypothetical protein